MKQNELIALFNEVLPGFLPEESGFQLFSDPADGALERYSPTARANVPTGGFNLDRIVAQAEILARRCIEIREQRLGVDASAILFLSERMENKKKLTIKRKQVDNGIFKLPIELSRIEREVRELRKRFVEEKSLLHGRSVEVRTDHDKQHDEHVRLSGQVSLLSAYQHTTQLRERAEELQASTFAYEKIGAEIGELENKVSAAAEDAAVNVATLREDYHINDEDLQIGLIEAEEERENVLVQAATSPQSGVNYKKRVIEIQEHFDITFFRLIEKINLIRVGLERFLGIVDNSDPANGKGTVNELLAWVVNVAEILNRLAMNETRSVSAKSCRKSMGETAWEQAKISGRFELEINENWFDGQALIRVVSLQTSVICQRNSIWSARVKFPEKAIIVEPDGSTVEVEYPRQQRITLGDIGLRHHTNERGYADGEAVMNLSPIGQWVLELEDILQAKLDDLEDLIFDLEIRSVSRG
jgi:hypothetical protein